MVLQLMRSNGLEEVILDLNKNTGAHWLSVQSRQRKFHVDYGENTYEKDFLVSIDYQYRGRNLSNLFRKQRGDDATELSTRLPWRRELSDRYRAG